MQLRLSNTVKFGIMKIGRKVKIADLRENLDVTRIGELNEKDIERINKYKRALKTLTEC